MEFPQALLPIFLAIGILWLLFRRKRRSAPSKERSGQSRVGKRVRLTEQQIIALTAASFERPIYGENPSLMHAQMPDGGICFNIRTLESLDKRGYLKPNEKGGFLLTPEGEQGLRSSMGF